MGENKLALRGADQQSLRQPETTRASEPGPRHERNERRPATRSRAQGRLEPYLNGNTPAKPKSAGVLSNAGFQ